MKKPEKTTRVLSLDDALPTEMLPKWPTLDQGEPQDFRVFSVRRIDRRSPRTDKVGSYQVIDAPDWVNVVALTPERNLVMVEQYRHGLDAVTLEIPGGMVDDGEDSGLAAERELAEETGYVGSEPRRLGLVHPNPAIQSNAHSTWLIEDATYQLEPDLDEGEHIHVVEVPLADIEEHVRRGTITHSLVVCAFYWLTIG